MDVDEVTLDWGGNEEEESIQQRALEAAAAAAGQGPIAMNDEATLSGAESLLALASGAVSVDVQDDKDSDVVSLGGGEDDMQELFAYQSRTNLGGTAVGDTIAGAQSALTADIAQDRKRAKTPPTTSSSHHNAQEASKFSRNNSSETSRPDSKPNSQTKSQSSDPAHSPSFTRLLPPAGPLALPAKPVTIPPASSVRPSHPSIMSASSMAPSRERERELQRENRDGHKGKSGGHNHVSPESDALPLAPGWEMRRSRGEPQETYYYDTKTHQTTWHRSIATGMASNNVEGAASPAYATSAYVRGRGRDHAQASERRSPADRDPSQPRGTDLGTQPRSRPSRFDQIKPEPTARPVSSSLSFGERHYRPDENRSSPEEPPQESGNFHSRQMSGSGAPAFRRDPSPTSIPARPSLPHHDSDRDRLVSRHEQDRGPHDRMPPPQPLHLNGRSLGRNGERNVERDRSRSPGRGRMPHGSWPNDPATGRDTPGSPPRERRAPTGMDGSRSFGDSSLPPRRGAPQATRNGSPGYDERPRYPQPNHDQSSSRDRHRSPPERPRKRTRSTSPPFNDPNRPPTSRFPPQPHQLHRNLNIRGESNVTQREGYYQQPPFDTRDHQRLPRPSQDSPAPSGVRSRDGLRNAGGDGSRFSGRDDDENEAKRRKTFNDSDSAHTRRRLPPDVHDEDDIPDSDASHHNRAPLLPQADHYKENTSPPPSQPPLPRIPPNGTFPQSVPSGPRRGSLIRDNAPTFPQSNRPPPPVLAHRNDFDEPRVSSTTEPRRRFGDANEIPETISSDKDADRKPRERERGRDSYADLPTGPRAMEFDPDASTRAGRSPPRYHRTDRSPAPPSRHVPRQSERWDEPATLGPSRRQFGDSDWARRDRDRQSHENNRPQPSREHFTPTSRFGPQHSSQQRSPFNMAPYAPHAVSRGPSYPRVPPTEGHPFPSSEHYSSRVGQPPGGQKFFAGDRQIHRPPGPNSPQDSFRPLAPPEIQRRRSFSSVPPSNAERNRDLPQAPRGSLSPVSRIDPVPRLPPPRLLVSHSSVHSLNLPDRSRRADEDTLAIWKNEESTRRSPAAQARREDPSEDRHAEYRAASPPPSRSHSMAVPSHTAGKQMEHTDQASRSPKPVAANQLSPPVPVQNEMKMEGPTPPPKAVADGRMNESQLSGSAETHGDRTHIIPSETEPPRMTSAPPRIRRFSKPLTSNPEESGPSIREQVQTPFRSASLLDRLSNPPPPRGSPAPNLRDRMSLPGGNWKTGSGFFPGPFNEGLPSLRDRVQPINEARRPGWNTPAEDEWTNQGTEDGMGDWGGRRGKPRKRGRGQ